MLLSKERYKKTSRIYEEVLPDIQHQRGNENFLVWPEEKLNLNFLDKL
jgi:hypothetical protein